MVNSKFKINNTLTIITFTLILFGNYILIMSFNISKERIWFTDCSYITSVPFQVIRILQDLICNLIANNSISQIVSLLSDSSLSIERRNNAWIFSYNKYRGADRTIHHVLHLTSKEYGSSRNVSLTRFSKGGYIVASFVVRENFKTPAVGIASP